MCHRVLDADVIGDQLMKGPKVRAKRKYNN